MKYSKEDLLQQYNWQGESDSIYTGVPSRRVFDGANGNQVLFLINCFYDSSGFLSLNTGKKLEELLNTQLPSGLKSELAVFNWLKGIYLYHSG